MQLGVTAAGVGRADTGMNAGAGDAKEPNLLEVRPHGLKSMGYRVPLRLAIRRDEDREWRSVFDAAARKANEYLRAVMLPNHLCWVDGGVGSRKRPGSAVYQPWSSAVQSIHLAVRCVIQVLRSTQPTTVKPHRCVIPLPQAKPATVGLPKGIAVDGRMATSLHLGIAFP